jgi:hypothetical protein
MSDDNIIPFHGPDEEERKRHALAEAKRLALTCSKSEWEYYLSIGHAEKYGLETLAFRRMIEAEIEESERKQHEEQTILRERERQQDRAKREERADQREEERHKREEQREEEHRERKERKQAEKRETRAQYYRAHAHE